MRKPQRRSEPTASQLSCLLKIVREGPRPFIYSHGGNSRIQRRPSISPKYPSVAITATFTRVAQRAMTMSVSGRTFPLRPAHFHSAIPAETPPAPLRIGKAAFDLTMGRAFRGDQSRIFGVRYRCRNQPKVHQACRRGSPFSHRHKIVIGINGIGQFLRGKFYLERLREAGLLLCFSQSVVNGLSLIHI